MEYILRLMGDGFVSFIALIIHNVNTIIGYPIYNTARDSIWPQVTFVIMVISYIPKLL